jgi:hypothetical protein
MKIDYENTRQLGIGEVVLPTDFTAIAWDGGNEKELHYVDEPEVGKIVSLDELVEYRRSLQANPFDAICAEYGIETPMAKEALKLALENICLFDMKQRDYGSSNISGFGEFGVLVRMTDKMERLKNLWKMEKPKNESIDDSYVDLSNYALIALLVRKGIWK